MQGILIAAVLIALAYGTEDSPPAPQWPSAATFEFTMTDRTEEFELIVNTYYSAKNKAFRFDTWGGMNQIFVDSETLKGYYYFPKYSKGTSQLACATIDFPSNHPFVSPFPDVSKYNFVGNVSLYGVPSSKWVSELADSNVLFASTIWIQQQGKPGSEGPILAAADSISYTTGVDGRIEGEHRHSYVHYYNYIPGEPDANIFVRPQLNCDYTDAFIFPTHVYYDVLGARYLTLSSEAEGDSFSQTRRDIYEINRKVVESHNQGESGYKLELNQFAYLTEEEMKSYKGLRKGVSIDKSSPFPYSDEEVEELAKDLPESWDWRTHGAVTKVKNQRMCGSCWAFSTIGALEGANFLKTGDLVELSEQFLVDCSWDAGNEGCLGGSMNSALGWIRRIGGVMSETQYGEYFEENGWCRLNNETLIANIEDFTKVAPNVNAMKVALVNHGPIVVSIAVPNDFPHYKNGVYKPNSWDLSDHGVVLVGYGVLSGENYWLIKNSWDTTWGLEGYGLISADNDTLNILDEAYYITL